MTSLEFIEKEIEYYKQKKDKAVEWYVFLIKHNGSYAQIKRAEKERDAINNYLDNLQQIKNILEAWEVVNDGVMGDDFRYEFNICKADKEYNTFKKALTEWA